MAALIHQLAWYQTLDPRLASAGGSSAIVSVGHERSSEHPRASRHYQRTLRRRFGTAPKARVGSRYWRLAASGGSRLASGSLSPQRGPRRIRSVRTSAVVYGEQPATIQRGAHDHARWQSFTTHTPVEAGFDRFDPGLIAWYLKNYAEQGLSISLQDLMALGRRDRTDSAEPFNMAYLAVRGSGAVNGVSQLHGQVSRGIFQVLFPRWPEIEVPVTHVTNGVHTPTWDSVRADDLWEGACGKGRWHGATAGMEQNVRKVSDSDLWQLRTDSRGALVHYVRRRHAQQVGVRGASPEEVAKAAEVLDPDTLTLGFARRFASYKRPNLLLHDAERLVRILANRERPVQLVLAGKAHPQDAAGQGMIRQWIEFVRRPEVRSRVVFLSDYDLLMAEQLVQGVDLWVNTPRRPWEASGTSGMKVLVNGGLNLSELDGWWAEAWTPDVGWALGDGLEHDS